MWCPEGYVSWNEFLNQMFDVAERILSGLSAEKVKVDVSGQQKSMHVHSAQFYLERAGFAESDTEADLIVGITAAYLAVNFMESFPPSLASISGVKIQAEPWLFCHRDQLECCNFVWPLKESIELSSFFSYARHGGFDTESLLNRFAFIDQRTGEIRHKNGAFDYLVNGLSLSETEAASYVSLATKLEGFVVCWPSFPTAEEMREFLECLGPDEHLSKILDDEFGELGQTLTITAKRKRGRPSIRESAARAYFEAFPDGHVMLGKQWKDAARLVSDRLGQVVTVQTLKRGVGEWPR